MGLPAGLTIVDEPNEDKKELPSGLVLEGSDSAPDMTPKETEAAIESEDTFAPMPEGWNKGEFSVNERADRKGAKRAWKIQQIEESKQKGEVGATRSAFQKTGQIAGAAIDVVGSAIEDITIGIAGLSKAAYDVTVPDAAKKFINEGGESFGAGVFDMQHKLGVDEALSKSGDKLVKWWDSLDKQTRRTLHSTGLLASVIPVRQVVSNVGKSVSKVASTTKVGLVKNLAKEKLDDAVEFIRPHLSGKYEREALKRTRNGVYTPTTKEIAMGESLSNLKGFKVRGNPVKNKDVILDAINTKTIKLNTDVTKHGSEVAADKLNSIGDAVIKLTKDNADFVNVNQKVPLLRIVKVRELLKAEAASNGGKLTSSGILNVRRKWDAIVKERTPSAFAEGAKQFDPILNTDKVIRNKLNDILDDSVKVDIKPNRIEVSNLITASDNVVGRLQKTHDDFLKDVLNTIGGTARGFWATKTLAKFAGAGAVATGAAVNPQIAGGVMAMLGAGYATKKIVMSRPARQVLLGMMQGLEQAGKATKNAAELIKIKKHKTALAKLIANIAVSKSEEVK